MRIHVLGLPHTQTTEEFTTCAFTQKALNLCKMMHRRGHEVFHYGVEGSNPECTEHVDVMSEKEWEKRIGRPGTNYYNIETGGELASYHAKFAANMHAALAKRTGAPGTEIICQTWGGAQRTACEGIQQFLVESGIGYPESWADWRVYESYAWMHMHLGRDRLFGGRKWYWAVIPNAFPVENFTPNPNGKRGEDFLYLGRLNEDKGVGIAIDVAREVGRKIVIVGQGNPQPFLQGNPHARYMKPVGVEERRKLLANARAVFCLTQFVEPFCGVNVEAQLSGTPVITSDHGVFSETVVHGVTGFRGRAFEQWVWAAKNIDRIDGRVCREWAAANYSLERVALMYEEFFQQILNVRDAFGQPIAGPRGFYERHPGRTQLDWLVKKYPQAAVDLPLDLSRPHEAPTPAPSLPVPEPPAPYEEPGTSPPVVCVAVACKGQAKYLATAVRSLIAQTFTRWQAVISCGDDESEAKARALADLDPRIVVLPERTVLGLADARNKALAFGAPTPYCMALDADDVLAPTYLERLVPLAGPKTIAACNLQEFGRVGGNRSIDLLAAASEFATRIRQSNMITYASIFPRALWEEVDGYDPLMLCIEDWDFWIALSEEGASLTHVPERLFLYRIHAEQMTLRHQAYDAVFRAKLVLRYVNGEDAEAKRTVANMSPELKEKLEAQRQAFPVWAKRDDRQRAPGTPATLAAPAAARDLHDREFFEFMRSCRDPYRRLADAIHAVVGAHEAIDIGCGIGLQTLRLKELGWNILGADHAPVAIEMREPGIEIEPIDLTATPTKPRVFDCVVCTETAEHIPAEYADTIVENVARRATKTIVWSAATPGQEWEGHVNLQPPSYWLDKFAAHGWVVDAQRTVDLRRIMFETSAQHWGCKDNFHVLVRAEKIPKILHHVWLGSDLPEKYADFRKTWMLHHPGWRFILWNEASHIDDPKVAEVVADEQYTPIVKSDILRLYALKTMGGLYVDTDFECLRPFDDLLSTGGFHCGYQGPHDSVAALASGLMACPPNDPFVVRYLNAALEQLRLTSVKTANAEPHKTTGPWLLTKLSATASVVKHERSVFYPPLTDTPPEAYARHHWAGSDPEGWLGRQEKTAPLLSFVMRVHNEEKTLAASITSLLTIQVPIEIVIVLHRCTDRSKEIALAAPVPSRHRVRVVEYDTPISRAGLEMFVTPPDSPHSIPRYYEYAFGLATAPWKVKWDGDFIATTGFVKWVNERTWPTSGPPTVINVGHRLANSETVVSREPYVHNCLQGFAKRDFWEVPRFPDPFVREDAPDEAAFIHASDLEEAKPYWQEKPWFMSAESAEAEELRRRYDLAVQLIGPEPLGCARSRNPEADSYLARCKEVQDRIAT